ERRLASRLLLRWAIASSLVLVFATATAAVVTGSYYDRSRLTRAFGLGESALLFPAGAVAFLDAHARDARIYNDDVLGGYLIWRRQPPRPVFIDGRLQVYPGEVYRDYEAALEDPRTFAGLAARYGVTAAILSHPAPGRLELATTIARLPGWRIAYLD